MILQWLTSAATFFISEVTAFFRHTLQGTAELATSRHIELHTDTSEHAPQLNISIKPGNKALHDMVDSTYLGVDDLGLADIISQLLRLSSHSSGATQRCYSPSLQWK